jgi:hypothetical protein
MLNGAAFLPLGLSAGTDNMILTKGDRGSATVRTLRHAVLLVGGTLVVCCAATPVTRAQTLDIDELKGQIFDARMAQQSFGGLKYCSDLNGTSFYFQLRNRILNLEEYFRSLESLVKAGVYNPAKRRAWTLEDAKERWEEVKKQAQDDKRKCELVQSLPKLEKRLQELQAAADAEKKE